MIRGKKFLIVAFLALFLMASSVALADGPARLGPWQELETLVTVNSTGAIAITNVSASTIIASYHRVLGFAVVPYDVGANSELTIALYDSITTGGHTSTAIFDEAEWDDDGNNQPRWYPYPKRLAVGLSFTQGANTVSIIYYEDIRKF